MANLQRRSAWGNSQDFIEILCQLQLPYCIPSCPNQHPSSYHVICHFSPKLDDEVDWILIRCLGQNRLAAHPQASEPSASTDHRRLGISSMGDLAALATRPSLPPTLKELRNLSRRCCIFVSAPDLCFAFWCPLIKEGEKRRRTGRPPLKTWTR